MFPPPLLQICVVHGSINPTHHPMFLVGDATLIVYDVNIRPNTVHIGMLVEVLHLPREFVGSKHIVRWQQSKIFAQGHFVTHGPCLDRTIIDIDFHFSNSWVMVAVQHFSSIVR